MFLGSLYGNRRRIIAYVTWFLRKGDIPDLDLKQADKELLMDLRKADGCDTVLAADIKRGCQVVGLLKCVNRFALSHEYK